jgi:hypothetical protein
MTPELRSSLIGEPAEPEGGRRRRDEASASPPADRESVALWNPEWELHAPDFEGSPRKLPAFRGRENVLVTHPFGHEEPSTLTRQLTIPATGKTTLTATVTSDHDGGDWLFRASAGDQTLAEHRVHHDHQPWTTVQVDLTPLAGREVTLTLENAANGWNYEFGYWHSVAIEHAP